MLTATIGTAVIGRRTLVKDHCWVCGARFKNSIPPGPANREDHHIFPRNAGGTDGPLVSLCDQHHTCLHKIAERLHRGARYIDLLNGEDKDRVPKLLWLAHQVVRAEQAYIDDPNKRLASGISLTKEEVAMASQLQKLLGRGRNDILRAGLHLLYGKYFT